MASCFGLLQPAVLGDSVIRSAVGTSTNIIIRTTHRLAGAIDSLTWSGKEFFDSTDHGRQLQSAASFDCGLSGEFWAERYNPTEAGSRLDGAGPTSSSKLLELSARGNALRTKTQMAFWLAPKEDSSGRAALNKKMLSDVVLLKQVTIGIPGDQQVLDYRVSFTLPETEKHTLAQFEALTGYMPWEFGRFWKLDPGTGKLQPLDDGPGEQAWPVVLATESGSHAMGVFSPDQPSPGFEQAGYGRFRFPAEKVVKWNCVFRVRNPKAGEHRYRMFVAIGTLSQVETSLARLTKRPQGR